jgi:pyochelin biosynthesis protein PchC
MVGGDASRSFPGPVKGPSSLSEPPSPRRLAAGGSLKCFRRSGHAPVTLVCLPHAAGSAAFYSSWASELDADLDLVGVQYPGHQDRINEPFAPDLHSLAESVAGDIVANIPGKIAIFGHSFGANVAHEVALRLHSDCLAALFVSGRPGPSALRPGRIHQLPDDELWQTVIALGGVEAELQDNAQVREVVLPALRNDYRLAECYRPDPDMVTLHCPVTAFNGDRDNQVTLAGIAAWATVSSGEFRSVQFPGGHFYLLTRRHELLTEINAILAGNSRPEQA